MRRRRKALAAVQDRLDKFVVDEDTSALLTQEASREAGDLAAMTDPGNDLAAALVLGMFHWFRYQSLPAGEGQDDLAAATRYLGPVYQAEPDVIPEPLRHFYELGHTGDGDTGTNPIALTNRAVDLLRTYQRSGDPAVLVQATTLCRAAVAATPAGHPDRAAVLSNLGGALRSLAEHTGDIAVLTQAVESSRAAVPTPPPAIPATPRI